MEHENECEITKMETEMKTEMKHENENVKKTTNTKNAVAPQMVRT